MSGKTFEEFNREFFEYYSRKDYAGALDYLNGGADQYPQNTPIIVYNQACMLGVQNKVPEALAIFQQAADRGYWYAESQLREDTDLVSLQGNPDFERLLAQFKVHYEAKQANSVPTRTVVEPPGATAKPYPLLLALHGNNSNAVRSHDYWKSAANAGWLTAILQSSQIGMTDSNFIWSDEAKSESEVSQHRAELTRQYSIDPGRVVIGGFSMGGRIAASMGLTQPFPVQGIICLGAYLSGKLETWTDQIIAAGERGTRVYLIIGDKDNSYDDVCHFADALNTHRVACELKVYPEMGHVYPPDFDTVLVDALKFVTAQPAAVSR